MKELVIVLSESTENDALTLASAFDIISEQLEKLPKKEQDLFFRQTSKTSLYTRIWCQGAWNNE